MIKLPKEVKDVFKRCGQSGQEAYIVGPAVFSMIRGELPPDWDMVCLGSKEKIKELFPQSQDGGDFLRLTFAREEGEIIIDVFPREDSVEDYLKECAFSVYAMAYGPETGILDPTGGQADLEKKLVRVPETVGDVFRENPLLILETIEIAANYDFDISKKTYEAMVKHSSRLENLKKEDLRDSFCYIINAPYGGKGLRMLAGADCMPAIIGDVAKKLNRRQMEQFSAVCDGLHRIRQNEERRLGLFFTAIEGKKAEEAIRGLKFEAQTEQRLIDALYLMEKLHFIPNQIVLKDFLVQYGPERYEYLNNLAKAQRIIYDSPETRILARRAYMENIINNKEPIYVEDLAVSRKELTENGIQEDRVDEILIMLTDIVHRKVHENTKKDLIKYAKKFQRNKFTARTRKVKWLR